VDTSERRSRLHALGRGREDRLGKRRAPASPLRFRFRAPVSYSGIFASTPIADAQTVHVQDPRSNVFALDRFTGARRWARRFDNRNDGPSGLALGDGRIYGATDSDAVAARCENGCVVAPSPHEQARTGRAADISV